MEQVLAISYTRKALQDIDLIEQYIAYKGFPETAMSYTSRLMAHVKSLSILPNKNTLCKYPPFAKRNFRCSVFEKTYVIAYRITPHTVEVVRVIHGKRLVY